MVSVSGTQRSEHRHQLSDLEDEVQEPTTSYGEFLHVLKKQLPLTLLVEEASTTQNSMPPALGTPRTHPGNHHCKTFHIVSRHCSYFTSSHLYIPYPDPVYGLHQNRLSILQLDQLLHCCPQISR